VADEKVDIEFDVDDKASPKLRNMETGAHRLGKAVDGATRRFVDMAKGAAIFGALFNLGGAIRGAKDYIDHLDRISDLTGIAADRVGGISNAMEESGVAADEVEGIMARMVQRGTKLEEGNKAAANLAKKYGINLKEGPEKSLVAMSKAVVNSGLDAGQIGRALNVSAKSAAGMIDMLGKGPEVVKKMIEDGTLANSAFNEQAMAGMQEYNEATSRIGIAWKRLTAGIMIKLAPALTKLADKFSSSISGWADKAERFGIFLVNHMETIITLAKTYAKIMMASYAMQKLSGGKMTMGGMVAGAGKWVTKGGAGKWVTKGGGGLGLASAGGSIMSFFKGATALGPIIGMLGRLSIIGGAIGLIVAAFKAFPEIAGRIKDHFSRIFSALGKIGSSIAKMFSEDSPIGRGLAWLGEKLMSVFETVFGAIASVVEWISDRVERIAHWETKREQNLRRKAEEDIQRGEKIAAAQEKVKVITRELAGHRGKVTDEERKKFQEAEAALKRAHKLSPELFTGESKTRSAVEAQRKKFGGSLTGTPDKGDTYQDFRGSRFDIKQEFAEGFDPDRIAVAFASDLASVGERRLQSGFAPLYTVR